MRGLEDKVVIVAGGATGIGAATARRLGEEGAKVVVGDIDADGAARTATAIIEAGGSAEPVGFDLGDEESCKALIDTARQRFSAVHGLYNVGADLSTGNLGRDSDVVSVPNEVLRRTLDVNLLGYVFTSRYAIPEMLAAGGGSIVHTTSGVVLGLPKFCAYGMSKNAVIALSRHIAARWGKEGIRSNAIDPGITLTQNQKDMVTDEERAMILQTVSSDHFGEPEEVAAAVVFLLSSEARWVNGQTYGVGSQPAAH